MRKYIKKVLGAAAAVALIGAFVSLLGPQQSAVADVLGGSGNPQAVVGGVTIADGAATNVNAVVNCVGGTECFLTLTYQCKTNYAANATFPATDTNVVMVIQKGDGSHWLPTSAYLAAYTLTLAGNTASLTNFAYTNITVAGCPYLRIAYLTNGVGVDANCQVTNVTIKAWVK